MATDVQTPLRSHLHAFLTAVSFTDDPPAHHRLRDLTLLLTTSGAALIATLVLTSRTTQAFDADRSARSRDAQPTRDLVDPRRRA